MSNQTPVLSIGMIFRNDIRCIEKCLKALEPLRRAIPCELIMADTGSEDGSRAVAEQYADILFDFPWINDFSAARNAVMDRASGTWYFTVDTDEYLDEDISELVTFLRGGYRQETAAMLIQRNYESYELGENYSDFMAQRLLLLSTGVRYKGAIHEHWGLGNEHVRRAMPHTILHHDGYVELGGEKGKAKRERNVALLREELEKEPDSLRTLTQFIESGRLEDDYLDHLRHAMELVEDKRPGWDAVGPPIFRYAVLSANARKLPELEEWIQRAEELFPDSLFTQIDVAYLAFTHYWDEKDYARCVLFGERYLKGLEKYRTGIDMKALMFCTIQMASPKWERSLKIFLSSAYFHEKQPDRTVELIEGLDYTLLDKKQTVHLVMALRELHARSGIDTAPLITAVWKGITEPIPSKEQAVERKKAFLAFAQSVFPSRYQQDEKEHEDFCRHSYTLFLPLKDTSEIGIAACIMETEDAAQVEGLLSGVDEWAFFPPAALTHAIDIGVQFPILGHPLALEDMDSLASRIAQDRDTLLNLVLSMPKGMTEDNIQALAWRRGLCMAALRACSWENVDDTIGQNLIREFAEVEKLFLPLCYTAKALEGENQFLLPPLHRFGWHCVQAFAALDAGDTAGYVRFLRSGLKACPDVKNIVEFLLKCTVELQTPTPSAELMSLAKQVQSVLAKFAPDDPAVAALKQSEAYQKVAHLIEGTPAAAWGGLTQ